MPRDRDNYRDRDRRKRSRSRDRSSREKEKDRGKKEKPESKTEVKDRPDSNVETEAQKLKLQNEEKAKKRKEAWLKLKAESELNTSEPKDQPSVNEPSQQKAEVTQSITTTAAPVIEETLESSIQNSRHLDRTLLQEDMALDEPSDATTASSTSSANPDEVDPLDAFMADIHQQMTEKKPTQSDGLGHRYHSDEEEDVKEAVDSDEEIADKDDGEEEGSVSAIQKSGKNLLAVDHSKISYLPFRKNFYLEPPEVARFTKEEVAKLREVNSTRVRGKGCPKPATTFTQCGLSDKILALLEKYEYQKPTPIQAQSIPAVMSGRDIIGIAKTGSGKTLSFLLPMLRHILDQPALRAGDGPIGLVICPTRELAMQTHAEAKKFCKYLDMNCLAIYGGSGIKSQIGDLKRGAEIVVCTPGRMIDILCANGGKVTNLQRVSFLVLDEADRMFDMGFEPQIMKIIGNIRPDKQCVLFSATFPRQVEVMARKILVNPLEIVVGGISVVCDDVEQIIEILDENSKFKRLQELLKEWQEKGNILIFTTRQEAVDRLYTELCYAGFQHNLLALHGGKEQEDRDFTIDDFKRQVKNIMIATSVAARGLDVKDLNLVINYDAPNHMEDYVHRVGRTGRAGNKGTAITFITPEEERFAPDIARALEKSNVPVPAKLKEIVDSYNSKRQQGVLVAVASSGYGGKGYKFDESEHQKREMARKAAKRALGYDDDDEEEDYSVTFDEDGEPVYEASADPTSADFKKPDVTPLPAVDGKTPAAQQAVQQILGSKPSQFVASNPKLAAQIVREKLLSSSPMLQKMMYGPDHFVEEVEINDFPQQARWKVTHKDALSAITEFTGAAITTRGSFVPPGRNAPLGERKLYLVIEGPTVKSVKTAKQEINRILTEAAAASAPERAIYGKYSVL